MRDYPKVYTFLVQALCILLPLSYYPLISLGSFMGMHIDISLLYISLAAISLTGAYVFIRRARQLLTYPLPLLLFLAFSAWSLLSCLWSPNTFRAIATAGFLCALSASWVLLYAVKPVITRRTTRIIVATYILLCIMALWQVFGDALGISPHLTLLRDMYQSQVFGFARPTAFSLEPQFFASFLLIPITTISGQLLRLGYDRNRSLLLVALLSIFLLTLSRGALYALILGISATIILMVAYHRTTFRRVGLLAAIYGSSVLLAGLGMYTAAEINTRDTISGAAAVGKAVNQISLGRVSLPQPATHTPPTPPAATSESAAVAPTTPASTDGYVAVSTTSRLSMSEAAWKLWTQTPQTFLFGIGVGGFGAALHAHDQSFGLNSIVNNYYLETAVETGIVGLGLLLIILGIIAVKLYVRHYFALLGLLVALCLQWLFFSGNANIIHVWFVLGACVIVLYRKTAFVSRDAGSIIG